MIASCSPGAAASAAASARAIGAYSRGPPGRRGGRVAARALRGEEQAAVRLVPRAEVAHVQSLPPRHGQERLDHRPVGGQSVGARGAGVDVGLRRLAAARRPRRPGGRRVEGRRAARSRQRGSRASGRGRRSRRCRPRPSRSGRRGAAARRTTGRRAARSADAARGPGRPSPPGRTRSGRWPASLRGAGSRRPRMRRRRTATRAASGRRSPQPSSDGGDLFLVADAERRAAAAGGDDVRVIDLEAGALEAIDVVDLGPRT